jgi:hypothetical protein
VRASAGTEISLTIDRRDKVLLPSKSSFVLTSFNVPHRVATLFVKLQLFSDVNSRYISTDFHSFEKFDSVPIRSLTKSEPSSDDIALKVFSVSSTFGLFVALNGRPATIKISVNFSKDRKKFI